MGKDESATFSMGRIWLDEEQGFIRVEFVPGAHQDLDVAKQVISTILALSKGVARPVLVDARNLKTIDQEARSYFVGPESKAAWTANAMLTGSLMTNAMANIWLAVYNSIYAGRGRPAKLFSDESAAIAWLKEFCHGER